MPVLDQITEASDKLFDVAESTNERAHEATKTLVSRIQDADLPFADRIPAVTVPFIDKLPEPIDAIDAYFGFMSKGIETNRVFAGKIMNRIGDTEVPAAPVVKEAPVNKPTAKKTPANKATAKKAPAKKTTAKSTTKK